jgi:putative membrane protein
MALLGLGVAVFAWLIYRSGPSEIGRQLAAVGVWLPVILIPYAISYSFDTLGWRATLGKYKKNLRFVDLFLIRLAGEAVNQLTPSAYLGGEPLKAFLLRKANVPLSQGLASVIIAKTAITLAQAIFVLGSLIFAYARLAGEQGLLATLLIVLGLLFLVILLAGWVQRRGLFGFLIRLLSRLRIPNGFLKSRERELNAIDQTIRLFYREDKRHLFLSVLYYLIGWVAGAFEVYLLLFFLDLPVGAGDAIAIEALVSVIRSAFFFLPGGVGAQEGGNLFLFYLFGLPGEAAMTYSIVRRLRELLLIGIGLAFLVKNEVRPQPLAEVDLPNVSGEVES